MSWRDRQERTCRREITALLILAHLADWRATRRMREAVESLELCTALYDLPARQPHRKETGQ